jgi:hypothetical protein
MRNVTRVFRFYKKTKAKWWEVGVLPAANRGMLVTYLDRKLNPLELALEYQFQDLEYETMSLYTTAETVNSTLKEEYDRFGLNSPTEIKVVLGDDKDNMVEQFINCYYRVSDRLEEGKVTRSLKLKGCDLLFDWEEAGCPERWDWF